MPPSVARKFLVSGEVQGVGYRFFAQQAARRLGLAGYVGNLPDGRVETWAQGSAADLQAFEEQLREGPPFSGVDDVSREDARSRADFVDFRIAY